MIHKFIKVILSQVRRSLGITDLSEDLHVLRDIQTQEYISQELRNNPRYKDKRNLNHSEFKVFSQYGEDGIIWEIFQRIGTTNKYFVEIGAEKGTENNTLHLLFNGWRGCWIEGEKNYTDWINNNFMSLINKNILRVVHSFVTIENINNILLNQKVPKSFDFLSIDIDGNDYWIIKAIRDYNPRVICLEYNALFGSKINWIKPYNHNYKHTYGMDYGASLSSYNQLLHKRGYVLVACTFAGNNAFFIKKEFIKENFKQDLNIENIFHPARYYLYQKLAYPVTERLLQHIESESS